VAISLTSRNWLPLAGQLLRFRDLCAYHLGGYRSDGKHSPAECAWEALGFESYKAMQDSIYGPDIGDWNAHYRIGVDKLFASRGVTADSDDNARGRALYEMFHEAKDAGCPLPEIEREMNPQRRMINAR
jgi:hypothetical protein